jgi:Excalibur calcium-binding domain
MRHKSVVLFIALAAALAVMGASASAASGAIPARWKNCKTVNKRFPHGVGKLHAHDKTTSGEPVTNFRRSTGLYLEAMRQNRGLDRDHDGIACEKL